MMKTEDRTVHAVECQCLSWKPIIAGALMATGLSFLLNLFGAAIGLTAYTTNNTGVETLVFGGLLGIAIGIVASMFASGWIAGYLGSRYCGKRHLGALYGFLTWCLALIFAVFLATYAQHYIYLFSHFISGVPSGELTSGIQSMPGMQSIPGGSEKMMSKTPEVKQLVISTYIIFVLFFLSAFACSLGGHLGMTYESKE